MSEQLKQIMKYSLGITVSKSNNFYELCEDLSKYLLNIWSLQNNKKRLKFLVRFIKKKVK